MNMTVRIHDKIRQVLEDTPGLTQKGLAQRMGLNPAAINRMLYGRRNIMVDELPIIEDYLGISLAHSSGDHNQSSAAVSSQLGMSDIHQMRPLQGTPPVPVYSSVQTQDGLRLDRKNVLEWVARHPAQNNVRSAFALYVTSDQMAPRYFKGELIYLHPGRPPHAGADCLFETVSSGIVTGRLIADTTEKNLKLRQYNPQHDFDLAQDDIVSSALIIGRQ